MWCFRIAAIAVGLSIVVVSRAGAADCDSGHGCAIKCPDACAAIYLTRGDACTKFCVGASAVAMRTEPAPAPAALSARNLSDADIKELLKQPATKEKIRAIVCPPGQASAAPLPGHPER